MLFSHQGVLNTFLKKGTRDTNEPVNATLATAIIIFIFVSMGSIDFVAQIYQYVFPDHLWHTLFLLVLWNR